MELVLNFGWVLLAALMFCSWLRIDPRADLDRRMQFVALALLLIILFPVISVTDDLQAVRNPAEIDSCQRRDHGYSSPHSVSTPVAALPVLACGELSLAVLRGSVPGSLSAPNIDHPALHPIESRPPPPA